MGKILIIDDDVAFLGILSSYIRDSYPLLEVETCTDSVAALRTLSSGTISLLLVDLEMPGMDGLKLFQYAVQCGIDKNRIVILSGRDADYLHEQFPMGSCLAVLNKYEAKQKAVLDMIFSSLSKKAAAAL